MTNQERTKEDIHFVGDAVCVDLWYPDVPENEIKKVRVGLVDVRAADDILIEYDKDRDGWVIKQASVFEWECDDEVCDPDWQEVAFVQAWGREDESKRHADSPFNMTL